MLRIFLSSYIFGDTHEVIFLLKSLYLLRIFYLISSIICDYVSLSFVLQKTLTFLPQKNSRARKQFLINSIVDDCIFSRANSRWYKRENALHHFLIKYFDPIDCGISKQELDLFYFLICCMKLIRLKGSLITHFVIVHPKQASETKGRKYSITLVFLKESWQ